MILCDPRREPVLDGGQARMYVFSLPDPEEAKRWGQKVLGSVLGWDWRKLHLRLEGNHMILAFKASHATKGQLEEHFSLRDVP